jgi:hypothetical protein
LKAASLKCRQGRHECRDWSVPPQGPEKSARVDLGIACLHAVALPGVRYTQEEIAAWAGCTHTAIMLIEQRALRKLRARLLFARDPILVEAAQHFFPDAGKRKGVAA